MKGGIPRIILMAAVGLAILVVASESAVACPTCMPDPDDPMTKALSTAVLFLLGVVGSMLSGIVGFACYLAKRARHPLEMPQEIEEMMKVTEGGGDA